MRRFLLSASALLGAAVLLSSTPSEVGAQAQQTLVVQGGTLIDGNGGPPIANSVIVIVGDRITQVGRAGQIRAPAGAQIINANGKWVTPGLIDAKANWNWQYGEPYLVWGVTSAIASNGRNNQGLAERDAVRRGIYRSARLHEAVVTIDGPGPMLNKPENYRPGAGSRIPRTAEDAVAHVRQMVESGADIITFQNGDGPPGIYGPAIAEAQRLGKGIDFRAMGPQTRAREVCAMGNGIVLVHSGNVGAQMAKDETKWATYIGLPPDAYADMDEAKVGPMIQHLVRCSAYMEPDLMATARGFHKNWARVQEENNAFKATLPAYYPPHSIAGVIENTKSPETYLTAEQIQLHRAGFNNQMAFLKRFVAAGGKIVAASDTPQTFPGLGLHQEITAFQEEVGLTPMQALLAGTSMVADGFKIADIGRIQAGKFADIVIVNANPLQDVRNLRQIDTVIQGGKLVDRKYDPNYRGAMFHNPTPMDYGTLVEGTDWMAALKQATWRPQTRNGGWGQAGGIDSELAPTPGIEMVAPHTILRGRQVTPVKITGFNFVRGSKAWVRSTEVPTKVISQTELEIMVPQEILAEAGKMRVEVRNPKPLASPYWGDSSNPAFILVPFEFTKILPQPQW